VLARRPQPARFFVRLLVSQGDLFAEIVEGRRGRRTPWTWLVRFLRHALPLLWLPTEIRPREECESATLSGGGCLSSLASTPAGRATCRRWLSPARRARRDPQRTRGTAGVRRDRSPGTRPHHLGPVATSRPPSLGARDAELIDRGDTGRDRFGVRMLLVGVRSRSCPHRFARARNPHVCRVCEVSKIRRRGALGGCQLNLTRAMIAFALPPPSVIVTRAPSWLPAARMSIAWPCGVSLKVR
jgi:hypothetical protein